MNRTVRVDLSDRSYDISIGHDLEIGTAGAIPKNCRAMIISDSNVEPLHGDWCRKKLDESGIESDTHVIPAGEESKSLNTMAELYDRAVDLHLDRSSLVVALGGGVVGDLAGFLAATYLRGIRLVQVPTSLLAMVDSSVGGKTGVNLARGKNLVGSFYQPVEVVVELSTLKTLPEREYISGLAEVVKYGVIRDKALFESLEGCASELLSRNMELLVDIVARCCEIKAEVVGDDERESGTRAILNFGHTLGHAIENVLGYGEWLHGEAVAAGMAYATKLSERVRGLNSDESARIISLVSGLGLPADWHGPGGDLAWQALRNAMATDKKAMGRIPRFVLADTIGEVTFGCEIPEDVLCEAYGMD
ncbi:MAG: 3-dehydroquinate synthase [Kiritimatiellia bacterium]|jgi:3-dehydroquinate synthase|nr:3-dehydroquinate synthase [Kiritimatiellia bacterium]MDP6847733.1 3-dehydroquinate synthase [Kiritimatiellia bacterium]